MTEDIDPTPRHGHSRDPSSASIDVIEHRINEHERRLRELARTCASIDKTLAAINDTCHSIDKRLSLGDARMNQIDTHLTATDTRLEEMEDDSTAALKEGARRDPVTFWTSIGASATAVGAILTTIFGGK